MDNESIRKDIFVAVITNGSIQQKERWQITCDQAAEWIFKSDTQRKVALKKKSKGKVGTVKAPTKRCSSTERILEQD